MGEAFRLGGWGMIPTMIVGLLLVASAVRYAMSPERRYVPLQISLGILTLACGGLGFVTGMMRSFSAVGAVPADERWIWMIGTSESLNNIALALALVSIGAIATSVGALRVARA
jgi:hypothetical protein